MISMVNGTTPSDQRQFCESVVYRQALIPLNEIVTDVLKFEDVSKALKYSVENRKDIVKAIIEFK